MHFFFLNHILYNQVYWSWLIIYYGDSNELQD